MEQSDAVVAGGGVMPVTAGVRALVVIVVVVPALGGVLAGIMVPAYHDYTLRTKVAEVVGAAGPLKADVECAVSKRRAWTIGEVSFGSKYATGANVNAQGD